jgi:hypothetical protein
MSSCFGSLRTVGFGGGWERVTFTLKKLLLEMMFWRKEYIDVWWESLHLED